MVSEEESYNPAPRFLNLRLTEEDLSGYAINGYSDNIFK
jgi:hypothetical protein